MSFDRAHARLTMSPLWEWAKGKHIEGLSCITAHSPEILPLAQTGKLILDGAATKLLPHAVQLGTNCSQAVDGAYFGTSN